MGCLLQEDTTTLYQWTHGTMPYKLETSGENLHFLEVWIVRIKPPPRSLTGVAANTDQDLVTRIVQFTDKTGFLLVETITRCQKLGHGALSLRYS